MKFKFDEVQDAIVDLRAGKLIVVLDDKDREYEGDLIGAAISMTPEHINFMVTHARGAFVAVLAPEAWCDQLAIGKMGARNDSFNCTQFRVAVDARVGGSGSSVTDRALTVNVLGQASSSTNDFVQPGHVVPIAAHPGGLAARRGHTEAGVALMDLAGFSPPVAVDMEILDENGDMANATTLFAFAHKFSLKIITLDSIARYLVTCLQNTNSENIPDEKFNGENIFYENSLFIKSVIENTIATNELAFFSDATS